MIYREVPPPPKLAPFVRSVWLLEIHGGASLQDYILPDAYTELIVHYGLSAQGEVACDTDEETIFAGQVRRPFHLRLDPGVGMLGVRFKAEGAAALLKENLAKLSDTVVALEGWSPSLVSQLEDQVRQQSTRAGRVAAAFNFIEEHIDPEALDPQVAKIAALIRCRRGKLDITALMDQINLGQRQVERRFKSVTGLTMKEYNRIIRFKEALTLVENCPRVPLVEVALAAGYYDQAHFNREFKALSGKSPKTYLKSSGELTNLYLEQRDVENLQ